MNESQTQQPQSNDNTNSNKNIIIAATIAVFGISVIGYKFMAKQNTPMQISQPSDNTNSIMVNDANKSEQQSLSMYMDGTYTIIGEYISPGGPEQIEIRMTIENDVVTDVSAMPLATNPNSVKFQGEFANNFMPMVIGKNISDLKLDKVAGSSLSPKGFNNAVDKIKSEAAQS